VNLLAALAPAGEALNQVYNVAVGERTSLNALYTSLRTLLSRHSEQAARAWPRYRDFRKGDVRHSLADISKAHRLLGCKGASRSDFRWDDERGEQGIYLLEVNTQPGMTPLSLVPEQAKQRGTSYAELVEALIAEALE